MNRALVFASYVAAWTLPGFVLVFLVRALCWSIGIELVDEMRAATVYVALCANVMAGFMTAVNRMAL